MIAVMMAVGTVVMAVDIDYTVTTKGGTNLKTKTANTLADAFNDGTDGINTVANAHASAYDTVVDIKIGGNLTPGAAPQPEFGWQLHGTDQPTNYPTNGATNYKGFSSVTIDGATAAGGRSVIDMAGGNSNVLRVVHVQDSIAVKNIDLIGANLSTYGGTLQEVGGGGLMLGGNGIGGAHKAPGTITLDKVSVNGNTIDLTAAGAALENAFGAGVYVVGVGADAGGPNIAEGLSKVYFTDVNLRNNTLDVTKTGAGASIRGGGGRVSFAESFTYARGTVSGNKVIGQGVEHAAGGGLSVDGNYFEGTTTIAGVLFDNNQVTITGTGASVATEGVARGGGFYSNTYAADGDPVDIEIVFGKDGAHNTIFRNNKAIAIGTGGNDVDALGGGAFIHIAQTNVTFNGTEFNGNSAESKQGTAAGGALAIEGYSVATKAQGVAKVNLATFTGNSATGTTRATGGAVYVATGGGHVFTGNTYTSNSAAATAAGGTSYGGAVAFMTGDNTLNGETFESNTATGDTAHGGAVYFAEGANKILSSEFKTNSAADGAGFGGAISFGAAATGTEITGSTFEGNFVDAAATKNGSGGAVYFAGGQHTITGSSFKGNYVQSQGMGSIPLSGGAAYFGGAGGNTVTESHFLNNYVTAMDGQKALGGALYFESGTVANSVDKTIISGNKVTATNVNSQGGGIYIAGGDFELTGSTISRNTAKSDSNSQGGGIYYGGSGDLTITNSSLIGNSANTQATWGNAHGSAVYVAVTGTGSTLNLVADENKTTDISGNSSNGSSKVNGIYFGGVSSGPAELNVKGAGTVKVDNGISADMAGDFTFTKSDSGRLEWNGTNSFSTGTFATAGKTVIDLQKGDVHLGADFTAAATGNSNFHVTISKDVNMTFDPTRDSTLAMFDFTQNFSTDPDSDKMTVGDASGKVAISAGIGRSVYSSKKEYTLVSGITDPDKLKDIMDGFVYKDSSVYTNSGGLYIDGSNLKVGYNYASPFDSNGPNAKSAQDAMNDLLNIQPPISDAEWNGILGNVRAAYPELYMDQARIVMDAVDFMSRSAVDYGLRSPHRTRMITEFGYMPQVMHGETLTPYDDYGDPVREGYVYNDGMSYDSSSAYPNAILEKCGTLLPSPKGFRLWAGYAGNWQDMDSHAGLNGYEVDRNGFLIGLNYDFGPAASVGVYGGYSSSKSTAKQINSTVDSTAGHFGLIGRLSPLSNYREFSLYADFGYHFANNDFDRQLGGWGAAGSFDQTIVTMGLGAEHIFRVGAINLIPHAEARFIDLDQDPMTEHGRSMTLTHVDGVNKKGFNMRMGVEVSRDYFHDLALISPTFNLSWRHDFSNHNYASDAYYLKSPTLRNFSVESSRMDRDSLDVGVALRMLRAVGASSTLGANIGYNMNLSRNSSTHSLYAGCEVGF